MRATEILRREHSLILRALDVLEEVSLRIRQGRRVAPDQVIRTLDFLRNYGGTYHFAKEEGVLIPWIEAEVGSSQPRVVAWLRREHAAARAHLHAAARATRRLPESGRSMLEHVQAYVWMTRWQVTMEENLVLPIAETLGSPEADASLLVGYEVAVPDADAIEARYLSLLVDLEARFSLDPTSPPGAVDQAA